MHRRKMVWFEVDDFVRNLRGIDGGADVDRDTLEGVYERIREDPFKPGSDHVTQVHFIFEKKKLYYSQNN